MKVRLVRSIACSVLLFPGARIYAQTPPSAPPQQPPSAPGTPPTPKPNVQLPPTPAPAKPPRPAEHDTGGDAVSIEPFAWIVHSSPLLRPGRHVTVGNPLSLRMPGRPKYGLGVIATIPTTRETSLEFTYFYVKAQGNTTMPSTLNFFGNDFALGDIVAANWLDRDLKLSWNFLTWPYPSNGVKFRVKTLWEVQYDESQAILAAPQDVNAIATTGSKRVILPTLGVGIEYHPEKHLRLELKGSGFGILHHADIWDAEGSLVLRVSRIEVLVGGRALHFKTSPQADEYFEQTMTGPYAGVRYLFTK